jgi:hypothetical protein
MYKRFWLGNLKGRGYLEDIDVDGRIILIHILKKAKKESPRIGTCGHIL